MLLRKKALIEKIEMQIFIICIINCDMYIHAC